jgi:hypothetical protein
MTQLGDNNALTVDVSGSDNLFATLQDGNDNQIDHTVGGSGVGNQAAIVQLGSNNLSSTTQIGSNNNLGVVQ